MHSSVDGSSVPPNPTGQVCPACQAWLLRADDAWCGYCGNPCAHITLTVVPSTLYVGHRPPRLVVTLTNESCAELPLTSLEVPAWMSPHAKPRRLSPNTPDTWTSAADYTAIRAPQSAFLRAATPAGEAVAEVLWIAETPVLRCDPPRLEVWAGCDAGANHVPFTVRTESGKLRIRGVSPAELPSSPGSLSNSRIEGSLAALDELSAPASATSFILHFDARGFDPADFSAHLLATYDSPNGPARSRIPVTLAVRRPPELRWDDQHRPPTVLHQSNRQRLRFTFKNQSPDGRSGGGQNAPVRITGFELTPPPSVAITASLLDPLPITLPGGETWIAECDLDLQSLRGLPRRQLVFQLTVTTNYPTLRSPVTILVEPLRQLDGIVAIDFGSSNTCCAILQPGAELELVPLDHASAVSPTVLSYLSLASEPPNIDTGAHIKRAVEDDQRAASTADRLKQRLGSERQTLSIRPKNSVDWMTREAAQAATDYLRSVRQSIEREKNATFNDFVLTHPARCSLRQYQRLRRALVDAFASPGATVGFLQEPIAALIPLMAERAALPKPQAYTVASFDLGGGTTDIALVNVHYETTAPGRLNIHPNIVFCRGIAFGGENLSDYLVAEIESRCREFLAAAQPGANLIAEGVSGSSALDIRRNRAALLETAEAFKASLSEQASSPEPEKIPLRITLPGGLTSGFNVDFRPIRSSVGGDLVRQFVAHTRGEVARAAGLLTQALTATGVQLDLIQLSGMTTFLPAVGETLAELFPGVRIVRPPDPKECVVRGACLSRSLLRGPIVLRLPDPQRTTSTIGLFSSQDSAFQPVFPVDHSIPPEGLVRELPNFWDGKESIILWEDLNDLHDAVPYHSAAAQLGRLGTWKPQRTVQLPPGRRWSIRLVLRDLQVEIYALDPGGPAVPFLSPSQEGS